MTLHRRRVPEEERVDFLKGGTIEQLKNFCRIGHIYFAGSIQLDGTSEIHSTDKYKSQFTSRFSHSILNIY